MKVERESLVLRKLAEKEKCGKTTYVYIANGKRLCIHALCKVYKISKNTISKLNKLLQNNSFVKVNQVRTYTKETVEAISWLEHYATVHGDRMPHKREIHLPPRTLKKQVYKEYTAEVKKPVSLQTFYKLWSKHFSMLKMKKVSETIIYVYVYIYIF